jgi:hypothetical protein
VAVTGEVYDITLGHLQRVLEVEPAGLGLGVVGHLSSHANPAGKGRGGRAIIECRQTI